MTVINDLQNHGGRVDFRVLHAMLDYIDRYPDRFHHPKEDQYLFRLLRLRAPDAAGLLDSLEAEHRKNIDLMSDLRCALQHFEEAPGDTARDRKSLVRGKSGSVREKFGGRRIYK